RPVVADGPASWMCDRNPALVISRTVTGEAEAGAPCFLAVTSVTTDWTGEPSSGTAAPAARRARSGRSRNAGVPGPKPTTERAGVPGARARVSPSAAVPAEERNSG